MGESGTGFQKKSSGEKGRKRIRIEGEISRQFSSTFTGTQGRARLITGSKHANSSEAWDTTYCLSTTGVLETLPTWSQPRVEHSWTPGPSLSTQEGASVSPDPLSFCGATPLVRVSPFRWLLRSRQKTSKIYPRA